MCMIDDNERPDFYCTTVILRCRKEHTCSECQRLIAKGESYHRTFGVWEGCVDNFTTCAHCQVVQSWLVTECKGFVHGMIGADIAEHADDYRRRDLKRLEVGMKWQWSNRHGLMAVPRQPLGLTEFRDAAL